MVGPANHGIHLAAPALPAHQPLGRVWHRRLDAAMLGHLGQVGLDLVAAIPAPHYEREVRRAGAPQRHRRGRTRSGHTNLWLTWPVSQPF